MDNYTATELAYKNGYEQGKKDAVVHARWEKDPDMRRMNGHIYDYRCSRCHCSAEKGCYNEFDRLTHYCPNCGAIMDGGEAE